MKRSTILGLLVAGLGTAAQANQIGTGLDSAGNPLAAGAAEQNYTVTDLGQGSAPGAPIAITPPSAIVYPSSQWPLAAGPWVPNTPNGQWITPTSPDPTSNGGSQAAPQFWGFTYNGTLTGFSSISGQFSSDNPAELLVNGKQVATTPGWSDVGNFSDQQTYMSWFQFSAALNPSGPNTVEFIVYNVPNGSSTGDPAGLIVQGTVPDGGLTAMLLGIGMVGLGAVRRKLS